MKIEVRELAPDALDAAREFARRNLFARALLYATLEVPLLRERTHHWQATHRGRIVGVVGQVDDVFRHRAAPLAATLPGVAARLLERLERPASCLAPELLWRELEQAGARRSCEHLQMARLTRRPLPEPDRHVKRLDDPDELRAFLGAELTGLRCQLGPFFGVRDERGALTAAGGADFVSPELAQLAWIKSDGTRLARAIVVELVRELESSRRRVILQIAHDDRAAIELYAELGFRGSRRLGSYELSP